jgi:mannitol/fructose-specific phosphotransferase system IIA component (Ntr-type)
MTLAELTSPALLIPELEGNSVSTAIEELSQAMQRDGRVADWRVLFQAALNRESLVSTETEAGIAFPHARLAGITKVSFALGRKREPFPWGIGTPTALGVPVRLVFLIAAPEDDSMNYLSLISGLVRLAKASVLIEDLYAAENSMEMIAVLDKVELRTNSQKMERAAGAQR